LPCIANGNYEFSPVKFAQLYILGDRQCEQCSNDSNGDSWAVVKNGRGDNFVVRSRKVSFEFGRINKFSSWQMEVCNQTIRLIHFTLGSQGHAYVDENNLCFPKNENDKSSAWGL
jgi:hypothetical protein